MKSFIRQGYLAIFLVFLFATGSFADTVSWYTLKDGAPKAKAENKPMIVDFWYGKGCPRCERIDKNVYSNSVIAEKIMADFIPIRVDMTREMTDEEKQLGERYDYKMDCMLIFCDPDGNAYTDPEGKKLCFVESIDPEWFVVYLDMVKRQILKK